MSRINIRKLIPLCFFTSFCTLVSFACIAQTTYKSDLSGTTDWTLASTWEGASAPSTVLATDDSIIIVADHNVSLAGDLKSPSANNLRLYIYGHLTINGHLQARNDFKIFVADGGSLTIDSLIAGTKNNMNIEVNGIMTVNSSIELGNEADVTVNGLLDVDGNIEVGNSSVLDGEGDVVLGGTCEDNGSTFCESGPLPVELIYFSVKQSSGSVSLEWSTASELNNDYFTIERSRDGVRFDVISTVQGNGTANSTNTYQYTDINPPLGLSYYRLSQTDYDGTTEQFPMVSVLFAPDNNRLSIYPNPLYGNFMQLKVSGKQRNESITLRILDLQGRLMSEQSMLADEFGNIDRQIDVSNLQVKNTYIVNLISTAQNEFAKLQIE